MLNPRRWAGWVGGLLIGGCFGCAFEDGRNQGVVLLDEAALASGARVVQEPELERASALPILVDPTRPVSVYNAERSRGFQVDVGQLMWIRGAALELQLGTLGEDLPADRVQVRGPTGAVTELAEQVSADVLAQGAGLFELRVHDAFVHLGYASVESVFEVRPVVVAAPVALDVAALLDVAAPALAEPGALLREIDPVGVYRGEGGVLVLDAAGRFSGCGWLASGGRYDLEGHTIRLHADGQSRALELSEEGLRDADGALWALGVEGDEP